MGLANDVYAYEFNFKDKKPVFVLWSEGEKKLVDLSTYLITPNAKVTHIVTELDENNEPIYLPNEIVPANSIMINETPIFVEEIE